MLVNRLRLLSFENVEHNNHKNEIISVAEELKKANIIYYKMNSINKFGESIKNISKIQSKDIVTNAYHKNRTDLLTNKIDDVDKKM